METIKKFFERKGKNGSISIKEHEVNMWEKERYCYKRGDQFP